MEWLEPAITKKLELVYACIDDQPKINEFYNTIHKLLQAVPPEMTKVVLNLERMFSNAICTSGSMAYQMGVRDGLMLRKSIENICGLRTS